MTDPIQHFIATAVAPLADPAIRAAAETELRTRLEAAGAGTEANLSEMTAALEAADRRPRLKHWRKVLVGLMLVVSGLAGWDVTRHGGLPWLFLNDGVGSKNSPDWPQTYMTDSSARARLILTGDRTATDKADRWRPLWDSEPDNPAFLAQYAAAYFGNHRLLSPEILDAAKRIDPDNGWFPLMAAAGLAKEAVERGKPSPAETKAGKALPLKVLDETKLREALDLIREAAAKPRFATYQTELHRLRCGLLVPPDDLTAANVDLGLMVEADPGVTPYPFASVGTAMAAAARASAERRDPAEFMRLLADWQRLYRSALNEADSVLGQLFARTLAIKPIRDFRDAATALELPEQAAVFEKTLEAVRLGKVARDHASHDDPVADLLYERGSRMARNTIFFPQPHPPLTADDLRPGRLAEQARLDQQLAAAAWVLLGAGCGALVLPRQFNRRRGALAARMVLLLRPADHVIILLGGVLLPLAWFAAITRFTPLGAHAWGLGFSDLPLSLVQHAALWLLVLLAPITLARWRLGQRGAAGGMRGRRLRLDAACLGLLSLALPLTGLPQVVRDEELLAWLALGLLGIPALRLLVLTGKFLLPRSRCALRRAVIARAVLPAWLLAMLLCALALPFHYAEERHWTHADHLMRIPADMVGWNRYEAQCLPLLRQETAELLKPLDALRVP